eukprot:g31845.t1
MVKSKLDRLLARGAWHDEMKALANFSFTITDLLGKGATAEEGQKAVQGSVPLVGVVVDDSFCSPGRARPANGRTGGAFPRAAPYAVLQLFIDRAHALPAADLNGLSDPYVTAQINDQDLQVRTTTQNGTLAPRWGEEFHIPVYRPESVLTLYVHDEDFGTENIVGFAGSLVGLSDDLLGCVDISLERLPLNTKLSGWFDLHSVTKATSYRTRVALSESGEAQTVGRIRLQLTLRVQQPQDELYALCLGPPSFGEPLQPLNFGELMRPGETHVSSIARVLGRVGDFCGPLVTRAERFSSLVFGTAIFLVWRPHFILPLLIVKFCVVLLLSQPVPTEVSESAVSDPKLQQVFKAAEVGLAAQQYTEISMAQNQLGTCESCSTQACSELCFGPRRVGVGPLQRVAGLRASHTIDHHVSLLSGAELLCGSRAEGAVYLQVQGYLRHGMLRHGSDPGSYKSSERLETLRHLRFDSGRGGLLEQQLSGVLERAREATEATHVLVLPCPEATLGQVGKALRSASVSIYLSVSLPGELLEAAPREATPAAIAELLGGYISQAEKALGKPIDLVWMPYAAFKTGMGAKTTKHPGGLNIRNGVFED